MSNEQINFKGQEEGLVAKVDSAFSHQKTLATLLENANKKGDTAKISEIRQLIKLNDQKIKELDSLYRVTPSNKNLSSENMPGVIAEGDLADIHGFQGVEKRGTFGKQK